MQKNEPTRSLLLHLPEPLARQCRVTALYHRQTWNQLVEQALRHFLSSMEANGLFVAPPGEGVGQDAR